MRQHGLNSSGFLGAIPSHKPIQPVSLRVPKEHVQSTELVAQILSPERSTFGARPGGVERDRDLPILDANLTVGRVGAGTRARLDEAPWTRQKRAHELTRDQCRLVAGGDRRGKILAGHEGAAFFEVYGGKSRTECALPN